MPRANCTRTQHGERKEGPDALSGTSAHRQAMWVSMSKIPSLHQQRSRCQLWSYTEIFASVVSHGGLKMVFSMFGYSERVSTQLFSCSNICKCRWRIKVERIVHQNALTHKHLCESCRAVLLFSLLRSKAFLSPSVLWFLLRNVIHVLKTEKSFLTLCDFTLYPEQQKLGAFLDRFFTQFGLSLCQCGEELLCNLLARKR